MPAYEDSKSSKQRSKLAAGKREPISRNLTSLFAKHRLSRHGARRQVGGYSDAAQGDRLLDIEAGRRPDSQVSVEMSSLPPQWVEAAEEAREDLKLIREKLAQLTKAEQKRLLRVFSDDSSKDREVETLSCQISDLVRKCEQQIHQVKSRGAALSSDKDREFRQNVQRSLATQLQQLSQQFRQTQKEFLRDIQKRQKGSNWDDGPSAGRGMDTDFGFTDTQLLELESLEMNATQRSEEINQIASSISDLNTIFKELAVLVIDQGSILDRIDYNIEQVVVQSSEANKQLQKAEKSQKSNRAMKCIYFLVIANLIMILILIVKARH